MLIKVCGMRDPENIRAVERLDINWIGFIFWPQSSRYVSKKPAYLPTRQKRVGVFVDADMEEVKEKVKEYGLDIIQLHGKESAVYIRQLRSLCGDRVTAIIKALNIATAEDLAQTEPYEGIVDYFLFDARKPPREVGGWLSPGGTGMQFDWSVLTAYKGSTPFLLSGGIGPDDADHIREWFSAGSGSAATKCIGIDLNSCFEIKPALKDITLLNQFIGAIDTIGTIETIGTDSNPSKL